MTTLEIAFTFIFIPMMQSGPLGEIEHRDIQECMDTAQGEVCQPFYRPTLESCARWRRELLGSGILPHNGYYLECFQTTHEVYRPKEEL